MAFSTGPYRLYTAAIAVPGESTLHSSRLIDFAAQDYEVGDEGQYEGMDDVVQRVILAVSFATGVRPAIISPRDLRQAEQNVRDALAPMTGGPEPEIAIEGVSFERTSAGKVAILVKFKSLTTGNRSSATIP